MYAGFWLIESWLKIMNFLKLIESFLVFYLESSWVIGDDVSWY